MDFRDLGEAIESWNEMYCSAMSLRWSQVRQLNLSKEDIYICQDPLSVYSAPVKEAWTTRVKKYTLYLDEAFQALCQRPPVQSTRETQVAALLKVKILAAKLSLPGTLQTNTSVEHDTRDIITLARSVLDSEPILAVLDSDDGLIVGLFLAAVRSRQEDMRKEAITLLLKHPVSNDLWNSEMAAKVAGWCIAKEEEDSFGVTCPTGKLSVAESMTWFLSLGQIEPRVRQFYQHVATLWTPWECGGKISWLPA